MLGLDDKTREVLGIEAKDKDSAEQWLGAIARDYIKPPLQFYTHHIELLDEASSLLRNNVADQVPRSL